MSGSCQSARGADRGLISNALDSNDVDRAFLETVPYERRKDLGQFCTPPTVARAMVRWACGNRPRRFLDPAVGAGVFLSELARAEIDGIREVLAFDVDAGAIGVARRRVEPGRFASFRVRKADFLSAAVRGRFDAIVCNPPYVRHHRAKLPDAVFRRFDARCGRRLSRATNVYCLFLLRILDLLSDRGRAAVITPSEYLNADFGRQIKAALLEDPGFRGFIIFDHARSIFDGIMTTACITLIDRARPSDEIRRVFVDDVASVEGAFEAVAGSHATAPRRRGLMVERIARDKWDPAAKWGLRPVVRLSAAKRRRLRPLSDFARCMRGIATGANGFFTLTVAEAREWSLPRSALSPCITKAAHARAPILTPGRFDALAAAGKKTMVLNVENDDDDRVRSYLDHGRAQGVHRRYLPSHRRRWYLTEHRTPPDLLVTVFGRKRLRFVRNEASVLNLTAFHGVYLKPPLRRFLPFLICYFHSTAAARTFAAEHRVYGDGLLKFEPRDVERLLVPNLEEIEPTRLRRAAVLARRLRTCADPAPNADLQADLDALAQF